VPSQLQVVLQLIIQANKDLENHEKSRSWFLLDIVMESLKWLVILFLIARKSKESQETYYYGI